MGRPPSAGTADRRTSPWPVLVALGIVVSELGVFFGIVPLVIVGIVTFGGSCAGLVHEVGYSAAPSHAMRPLGGLFVVLGVGGWIATVPVLSVQAVLDAPAVDDIALRGAAVAAAGFVLVTASFAGRVWSTFADDRQRPVE